MWVAVNQLGGFIHAGKQYEVGEVYRFAAAEPWLAEKLRARTMIVTDADGVPLGPAPAPVPPPERIEWPEDGDAEMDEVNDIATELLFG